MTDPDGNVTTFAYDTARHVVEETDPLGNTASYSYDGAGNLVRQTDRDGRVRTFEYDAANRLRFERWFDPDGMLLRTITSTYDANGNLLTESDPDSSITRTYDRLDRVETETDAGTPGVPAVTLTYAYDAAGNVISITDDSGVQVLSAYDARNMLSTRTWQGGGIDPARANFSYNANGQVTQIDRFTDLARGAALGPHGDRVRHPRAGRVDEQHQRQRLDPGQFGYTYDRVAW